MPENKISEFLRDKKKSSVPGGIDWQAKKEEWIQSLNDLYKTITDKYLAPSIADKTVTVAESPKQISEEYIGDYVVTELILQVGDEKVMFSPKGMNIVGASGRVDLRGDMGDVTIIRQGKEWAVVATRTPKRTVVPLNEESLLGALKTVMRR